MFATNCDDVKPMVLLKEAITEGRATPKSQEQKRQDQVREMTLWYE